MVCGLTCDVVVESVNAEAECPVDSLECGINKFPVVVIIDYGVRVVVLEIRHSYEPPAEHYPWCAVVICDILKVLSAS